MTADKIAINPQRLQWCCTQNGIESDELHIRLKISQTTIDRAIHGEASLSIPQLKKISKFFDYGLLFFLHKQPASEEKIYSPQFRTINGKRPDLTADIKSIIKRAEWLREVYLGLSEELLEPVPTWKPGHLNLDEHDLEKTTLEVRQWLGFNGRINSFDALRQAVEDKGVFTIVSNGYKGQWKINNDHIRGLCLYDDHHPTIVIKKQTDGAQAFTMVHELAHILFHKSSFIDDDDDTYQSQQQEVFANRFAGLVLLPSRNLQEIDISGLIEQPIEGYDSYLEAFTSRHCVSVEVVLRRLMDEGQLSKKLYQAYRTHKQESSNSNAKGGMRWRDREPIHIFGKKYVGTVLSALHNQHITLVKASDYLDNLKIHDLHKLEAHVPL